MMADTRAEQNDKSRQQQKVIVQSISENVALKNKETRQPREPTQKTTLSTIQNTGTEGSTQMVEESVDGNDNTTQNDTSNGSKHIDEQAGASRNEEMKKRREQLQTVVQNVIKDIVQNKGASQIAEQNGIGSKQVEKMNGDSKSTTIGNIVAIRIEEQTRAFRNDVVKKRREQLRGIVQTVVKDIVQKKGASLIAEQNVSNSTSVVRESNTPKSIGSMQVEEMNNDSASNTIKSIVAPRIEETKRQREELPVLVQKVSEADIIQEGFLVKRLKNLKQGRKRWFILTSSCLYAFKNESDRTIPTDFIYLDDFLCVRVLPHSAGQNNVIFIHTPDRALLLSAPSVMERDAWTDSLNNMCILSMVVGGCLGHRLSRFAIVEEDENGCEIEDYLEIERVDSEPWVWVWV